MAETLLWVLPLVPVVTALLMLTTGDRRILSAIDIVGSAVLLALTLVLARQVAEGEADASHQAASSSPRGRSGAARNSS